MGTWHNSDGLLVRFGRDVGKRQASSGATRGSAVRTAGSYSELVLQVDLEGAARTLFTADRDNDGTLDGFELGLDTPIPSGAKIIGYEIIEHEAPAGGTSYSVGTFQVDGTAIDADGIRTDAGADGAQVTTELSEAGYVTVTTIGTYTAGKLTVIVRFVMEPAATLA